AVNQRGIDVVVRVFAPDGSRIAEIDSPNGTQGDEPVALEAKAAGTYRVEISSLGKDAPPVRYEIRIIEIPRFVLWAHNGHISTGDSDGRYPTFGHHLRRFYGKDYYALGFSFNQGSFQSMEAQPKDPTKRMLMSFTTNAAPADSIDWYLAQTGVKILIVDFSASHKNAGLGEWLAAPHPMRSIGSMYGPNLAASSFRPTTISKEFDGL